MYQAPQVSVSAGSSESIFRKAFKQPAHSKVLEHACEGVFPVCLQGVVMMVQNRYQRRRMYTRIALGKNRAMDVVSGESSGGSGQLLFLYPMLFALQVLQCWIGERLKISPCPLGICKQVGASSVARCKCVPALPFMLHRHITAEDRHLQHLSSDNLLHLPFQLVSWDACCLLVCPSGAVM